MSTDPPKNSPERETLSRVRRIETRVTQLLVAAGIDVQAQKPCFTNHKHEGARLTLPSRHSSMKEILDNIPDTWNGSVEVFVGDDHVATISKRFLQPNDDRGVVQDVGSRHKLA